MLAKEPGGSTFDLPEEVLQVLPSDPFEQLDVARKITSIALATRVSDLETESAGLTAKLAEKESLIDQLHAQIESLDSSLSDTADKLAQAQIEKENLIKENVTLSDTVRKLQRDVSKLEVFRKTLVRSLQEDEEALTGAPIAKPTPNEDIATHPPTRTTSIQSQNSEAGNSSLAEDHDPEPSRPGISHGILWASQGNTPRLTPPGSPPSLSASVSPKKTSKLVSPRRHSISFSSSRGIFDDRSSIFSSAHSAHSSISSTDSGSQTGRARVDGKEFFRQVRSRLSYEQFGAFLANVKELNAHKQTKEETLRKADEIFGPDNKDLYAVFEGLITRNVH